MTQIKKCKRFNSRFWCKGTEGVDCFTENWSNELNWVVPPPILICKSVNKMINEKAAGTLLIPVWKSAPFWPMVCSNGIFENFVKDILYIEGENITARGRGSRGVFNEKQQNFMFVALKIRF